MEERSALRRILLGRDPLLRALLLALLLLLIWTADRNRVRLTPDGVAYLALAEHVAEGRLSLAIAPYWGPLLPWLTAPALALGVDPLRAGHLFASLGGLLFAAGAHALLRALGLGRLAAAAGLAIAGLFAAVHAAPLVVPDFWLAGAIALGSARILRRSWLRRGRAAVWAGVWLGVAALAKPVGLPLALLLLAAFAATWRLAGGARGGALLRSAAITAGLALALFAPWAAAVAGTAGAGGLVRTARVNLALVGPDARAPEHPASQQLARPPAGRIAVWENPSGEGYGHWSPFDGSKALRRFLGNVRRNWDLVLPLLERYDRFGLGIVALIVAFFLHRPFRRQLRRQRWRWALVGAFACVVIYLPVHAEAARYFWPAYPFFLAAGFGLAAHFLRGWPVRRALGVLAVAWIFLTAPWQDSIANVVRGRQQARVAEALDLAARLERAGVEGPVAGERIDSLYVAWRLGRPWLGYRADDPDPATFERAGARLLVVRRDSPLDRALRDSQRWRRIDADGARARAYEPRGS